jgi:hypothetical protein
MEHDAAHAFTPCFDPSHDFLNELMIVIGECDLLHEELLEYRYSRHLRMIREAAVRMSQRLAEHQLFASQNLH